MKEKSVKEMNNESANSNKEIVTNESPSNNDSTNNSKATVSNKHIEPEYKVRYYHLFWLFMVGNVLGVLVEGVYCLVAYGQWETHVTFLWGWFNIVYGFGAIAVYLVAVVLKKQKFWVKFICFTLFASLVEYIIGVFAQYVLHTKAWNYDTMMIGEHISIPFSLAWGVLGTLFAQFLVPLLNKLFAKMQGKVFVVVSNICMVLMIINLIVSTTVQIRWGQRPSKPEPTNAIERFIDEHYPDDVLQNRFVEWVRR